MSQFLSDVQKRLLEITKEKEAVLTQVRAWLIGKTVTINKHNYTGKTWESNHSSMAGRSWQFTGKEWMIVNDYGELVLCPPFGNATLLLSDCIVKD